MNENLFVSEYKILCAGVKKVYVVPLINYSSPQTDYLYQLYEPLLNKTETVNLEIESLSVFAHSKLLLSRLKDEKSILHYHWFEVTDLQSLVGMMWKVFWIALFRSFGGKIVWTVHNKFPHSKRYLWLNTIAGNLFARIAHRLHVHCETAVEIMAAAFSVPREKFFIVNHPEFPAVIIPKKTAREALKASYPEIEFTLDRKVFLMFGAIAEYKGIIEAIDIFKRHLPDKVLLIAGRVKRWDKKYFSKVVAKKQDASNVIVIARAIPETDVPLLMNSADYTLFNYTEILSSGSVVLALSYKKKIIAPSAGCLRELRGNNCTLFDTGNKDQLKSILVEAV